MKRRSFIRSMALAVGFTALSLGMLTRPKRPSFEGFYTVMNSDWNRMLHLMVEDQHLRMKTVFPLEPEVYYLHCSPEAKQHMIDNGLI